VKLHRTSLGILAEMKAIANPLECFHHEGREEREGALRAALSVLRDLRGLRGGT
jgi:hypothetical protein